MTIERNRSDIRLWTMLRGVAALAVVMFHFRLHLDFPLTVVPLIGPIILHGDLGVDMFFILSGFVMTYVYGDAERDAGFDVRSFLVRRFARIYPVHFVTSLGALTMLLVGASLGLAKVDIPYVLAALPAHLLLLHGIGFGNWGTLNYPSWSVSSEMFAYLCFPLFSLVYRRLPSPYLIVLPALVMLYVMMDATTLAAIGAVRVSTEFLLGMGLCRLLYGVRRRPLGLAVMAAGSALFIATVNCDGPRSLAISGLAALIAGALIADDPGARASAVGRVMTYLGQISYSIYMVHALVEAPGFKIAQRLTGAPEDRNAVWVLIPMIAVTIAAAAALYHLVEQPCRMLIVRRFETRRAKRRIRPEA